MTAYIVTGILIGPFFMNLIPKSVIDGMDFLSDIALAVSYTHLDVYKRQLVHSIPGRSYRR